MKDPKKRARDDLPDLSKYLEEAATNVSELISSAKFSDDNHYEFALLAFLSKLSEQTHSVKILVQNGHGRDAELVARSMLEGLAILLWMAQEPLLRPLQWRSFAAVHDWRRMQRQISEASEIKPTDALIIKKNIMTYGHLHTNPKRKAKADPYFWNWRGKATVKSIFDEVSGEMLYTEIYGPYSDWIHSGVQSIGGLLTRTEKGVTWNLPSPSSEATVYVTAFLSLAQALTLGAKQFQLDLVAKIEDLVDRFTARFGIDEET